MTMGQRNDNESNFSERDSEFEALTQYDTSHENSEKTVKLDSFISNTKFGLLHLRMLLTTGGAYFAVCAELVVFVFLSHPVKKEWNLNKFIFPLLPLGSGLGGILGECTFGIISDKYGRKWPFAIAVSTVALFGIASAFAPSFLVLVILRTCVSVGNGAVSSIVFVYLLEFLPQKNRGKCMVGVTFCGALGAVFAGGMAWWLLESYSWRHFMAACAAPAFIVCIAAFCLTEESPRFLFISGQEHRGKMVLQKMIHEPLAWQGEIECMPSEKRGRISQLFAPGTRLKTINIALIWFLQATGYWGVTVYLPEYMGSLGVDPYFNMFTVFIGELPGLCLAMIMIEPYMLGRIRCLQLFSFSTCISLLLFAFVGMDFLKAVSVIVCYFFMVPIYSILSTFTPEAYPTHIRSTAVATMYMIIEIPGLITPFVGEYLLSSDITWLYPVVWAGVFFLQALAICGLRSETAGKALKDSDKENDSDKETLSDEMAESAIS
ncbi:synaptic vesicle 2-related protein-like isoform X1 [Saccostrea cucullata]|uniref:synaptic vesicle 2-related protein-like isoform X1 n=1 Tax=Saccostrea cuccullata TaxID=36930 RepID=UPI002ED55258